MRQHLRSTDVAGMLDSIAHRRPLPQVLKADNGSEFAGNILDRWVYESGIGVSRPGTPADNATVGSFNGRLRQAGLNENGFISLVDERCKIEAWRIHDNQRRPHCEPGWIPSAFDEKSAGCQNMQPE
ncbi:transposase family protein [Edwardsiella ictaluri]|uniref:Integrase core domain-containing protein n=1 Tax=Edwardsiella ictaluri TaxID=67780 RepID=A0ABY8GJC6_EDWIC|nr:integrase core domain-containing protein [Edwardsiella ictaluri]ELV7529396.1 transposase family protein [Edwardsiella ictaluri]WFN97588.1 integrase core domain-containing protein [Edwardsiella ictaluri]